MAQKITKNQLKRLINEVLNEGFYYPINIEAQKKFDEVCLDILYPHVKGDRKTVADRPLTKEQFMDTLTKLGEQFYQRMGLREMWSRS